MSIDAAQCHYAKINTNMYQYGVISPPLVLNKWFVYCDGEYFFIVENGIVHMLKFDIQTIQGLDKALLNFVHKKIA